MITCLVVSLYIYVVMPFLHQRNCDRASPLVNLTVLLLWCEEVQLYPEHYDEEKQWGAMPLAGCWYPLACRRAALAAGETLAVRRDHIHAQESPHTWQSELRAVSSKPKRTLVPQGGQQTTEIPR